MPFPIFPSPRALFDWQLCSANLLSHVGPIALMQREETMPAKAFQAVADRLVGLIAAQPEVLIETVTRRSMVADAVALIDHRFAAAPRCADHLPKPMQAIRLGAS